MQFLIAISYNTPLSNAGFWFCSISEEDITEEPSASSLGQLDIVEKLRIAILAENLEEAVRHYCCIVIGLVK